MTGPLSVLLAFVTSAVLSRPKLPELEPESFVCKRCGAKSFNPNDIRERYCGRCHEFAEIAELKEKLRICEAARDAARADRDHSDAQLRALTLAYQPVGVRDEALHRAQQRIDVLLRMFAEEQARRILAEREVLDMSAHMTAERINSKRSQAPRHLPLPPAPLTESIRPGGHQVIDPGHIPAPIMAGMDAILRQMDSFICNCAPGRHELFVRPTPEDVARDYDALFGAVGPTGAYPASPAGANGPAGPIGFDEITGDDTI